MKTNKLYPLYSLIVLETSLYGLMLQWNQVKTLEIDLITNVGYSRAFLLAYEEQG
jgi:hypothetical protein